MYELQKDVPPGSLFPPVPTPHPSTADTIQVGTHFGPMTNPGWPGRSDPSGANEGRAKGGLA